MPRSVPELLSVSGGVDSFPQRGGTGSGSKDHYVGALTVANSGRVGWTVSLGDVERINTTLFLLITINYTLFLFFTLHFTTTLYCSLSYYNFHY